MRVEKEGRLIVLSRRNLLTLLEKLDGHPPNSACTIGAPPQYGHYEVKAEPDHVHYFHRDREAHGVAGAMHPDTELHLPAPEAGVDENLEIRRPRVGR